MSYVIEAWQPPSLPVAGTGVGAVASGDAIEAHVAGVGDLNLKIG